MPNLNIWQRFLLIKNYTLLNPELSKPKMTINFFFSFKVICQLNINLYPRGTGAHGLRHRRKKKGSLWFLPRAGQSPGVRESKESLHYPLLPALVTKTPFCATQSHLPGVFAQPSAVVFRVTSRHGWTGRPRDPLCSQGTPHPSTRATGPSCPRFSVKLRSCLGSSDQAFTFPSAQPQSAAHFYLGSSNNSLACLFSQRNPCRS